MRKTTLLMITGLISLVIMACRFGGIAIQISEPQPATVSETEDSSTAMEALPSEKFEDTEQIQIIPTPTIDPLSSAKSCLAKTWQINDLSDYVVAAIPAGLVEEYNLEYDSTSGGLYLTLSPDGKVVLQADHLALLFNAQVSIFQVPVTVSVDGTAIGTYTIDSNTLTIREMDTSRLKASAQALNEDVLESDQIIASIPFTHPPYNTAKYTCQAETLELELSGYYGKLPPLMFQTVK